MPRFLCFVFLFSLLWSCQDGENNTVSKERQLPEEVDFTFHVKPILSDRCFACHGPDEDKQEAGLALHTPELAYAELKESPGKFAIVPGDPSQSEIVKRINSPEENVVMPPPESHLTLSDYEKKVLERWVEQGAVYKDHWAFLPPEKPIVPTDYIGNPLDYFIDRKLEEVGLVVNVKAEKTSLLRRVSFDLTGLPPSPQEISDFLADDSPEAYEKVVDRLLASPHYGERMATDWLDLARYADSHGYQDDRPRSMWPWRDWVIRSFNKNLSYRDFVTWQLAGDLLPEPTYEQKLATGFNRNHPITQEGGVIAEEYLAEYASDRTHVFGTAFLGLTVECAKCHTHKYDPILHTDYYQLTSFFNNIEEQGQIDLYTPAPAPNLVVQDSMMEQEFAEIARHIADLENKRAKMFEELPDASLANLKIEDINPAPQVYFKLDEKSDKRILSSLTGQEDGWLNVNLPPTFALPKMVAGHRGNALAFDGNNFLSLGQRGDFEHYDHFAFSLWINHSKQHDRNAAIFGKRMDELRRNGYDLVLTERNTLSFRLTGFDYPWWTDTSLVTGLAVETLVSVDPNAWQHVAVNYNGSGRAAGVKIYLNGKLAETVMLRDRLDNHTILNGNLLCVGNWNQRGRITGMLYGFQGGLVDEFQIYPRELSDLEVSELAGRKDEEDEQLVWQHQVMHQSSQLQELDQELAALRRIDRKIPSVMIMQEKEEPKATFVRLRGEYDQHGPEVSREAPSFLPPLGEKSPKNRLGLAQWLFAADHPLTARVAVNRFWQQFFGRGIVASAADFGNQGDLPTHPQLLDWLAIRFRENNWDIKDLLKLIVTSQAYQRAATVSDTQHKTDPANCYLARGPMTKLSAEMLRDQALASSGLLNDKIGGKWVKPYQPDGLWYEMASDIGEPRYRAGAGNELYRRSLYTYFKRTIPPPSMLTLDAAERTTCTVTRQSTSTPLQALVTMNDDTYLEASRCLAQRELQKNGEISENLTNIFLAIVNRQPSKAEKKILDRLQTENLDYFQSAPQAALELLSVGASSYNISIDPELLAATALTTNAIYNLDEAKFK